MSVWRKRTWSMRTFMSFKNFSVVPCGLDLVTMHFNSDHILRILKCPQKRLTPILQCNVLYPYGHYFPNTHGDISTRLPFVSCLSQYQKQVFGGIALKCVFPLELNRYLYLSYRPFVAQTLYSNLLVSFFQPPFRRYDVTAEVFSCLKICIRPNTDLRPSPRWIFPFEERHITE